MGGSGEMFMSFVEPVCSGLLPPGASRILEKNPATVKQPVKYTFKSIGP